MMFDLGSDSGERNNLFFLDKMDTGWMLEIVFRTIAKYEKSVAQCPNIKPGEEFVGYKKVAVKSA